MGVPETLCVLVFGRLETLYILAWGILFRVFCDFDLFDWNFFGTLGISAMRFGYFSFEFFRWETFFFGGRPANERQHDFMAKIMNIWIPTLKNTPELLVSGRPDNFKDRFDFLKLYA